MLASLRRGLWRRRAPLDLRWSAAQRAMSGSGGNNERPPPRVSNLAAVPPVRENEMLCEVNADPAEEAALAPHWAALEQRILRRRSSRQGPVGRIGKKTWEEDVWLREGLYDAAEADGEKSSE
uniref:Uncharacterized protein n=1 Tax=Phaeomonas parva TaxID=124430 RepID=A0A7S1UFN8_9STRA|mmetsp:Transcript_42696/g.133816  ORF Transcript_42696/g.133816 Transcript_42696/m.133816 type:complete len:123 (+) Transcript_42696:78-446(+)|eukprot:CAMPEP_0118882720 /NCGR_PEP_ID=MMETSP1163-20130328/21911_1 /TAXON_ID=124430 /ORGANISM="Phaeomonas parva, Strain CCMP2877" /LENGTH=122 /DNA_ID=CAMNT_0006819885 /DNA_START=223 /DNA_END=591 /DNA_ORIENTATION=+